MAKSEEQMDFQESFDAPTLVDEVDLVDMTGDCANDEDVFFDNVVGHIEDVLVEDTFQTLLKCFMEKYWREFDNNEENKLCYMDIFKEYGEVIEKHIETQLLSKIPNFDMPAFIQLLQNRKADLDGEVFEVLDTFSDFQTFKEMFLDYRAMKEGKVADLSENIVISSTK